MHSFSASLLCLLLWIGTPTIGGTVTGTVEFPDGRRAPRGVIYLQHWTIRKNIDSVQIGEDGRFRIPIRNGSVYNFSLNADGIPGWITRLYCCENMHIRIVMGEPDDECRVVYRDSASFEARTNEAGKNLEAYSAKLRRHETRDTLWRDYIQVVDSLACGHADSISICKYLISRLFTIAYLRNATIADSTALLTLLNRIPSDSPLWVYINNGLFALLDHVNVIDYVDKVIQSLPDEESKNWFRFVYLQRGVARGDSVRVWAYAAAVTNGSNPELAAMARPFLPRRSSDAPPALRMSALEPGMAMPPFVFNRLSGKSQHFTSTALKQKRYLLGVWATWCGSCLNQMQYLDTAWSQYHSAGLEIVTVSVDDNPDAPLKYWKTTGGKRWMNLHAPEGLNNPFVKTLGVFAVPWEFLVDERGVVIASGKELVGPNLSKTLSRLLKR